ncbi:MAG: radical SAM protein [Nanoarchaeota archaeon]|nr:radical SAM protein [Nanoarchaeota archaeon]
MEKNNERKLPKLDLNVTNRCNYRCNHCAFDSGEKKLDEMSLEKIVQILKETKELGGEKFDITGGEAIIRRDVPDIIAAGKDLGYKIELISNGSLMTPEKIKLFKNLGLDSIAISLDGSDYEIHTITRTVSYEQYAKTLLAIENILANGIKLKINTAVSEANYRNVPQLTEWCAENDVFEHGLYYFTPVGRGQAGLLKAIEPITWLKFIRESLYDLGKEIKLSLEFPFIEKSLLKDGKLNGKNIECLAESEQYHLQILPDGNVYPCAIMASYSNPLANLHEKSMAEIWQTKNVWDDYWKKSADIFQKNNGCCVDFSSSFPKMDYSKYEFVCPLRKFYVEDVRELKVK